MSYDLTARGDDRYSARVRRAQASALVTSMPDAQPNGSSGFVVQRGEAFWMEVDLELVNEDGDTLDRDHEESSSEINCVRFHVPAAFHGSVHECIDAALRIATGLGWQLHDEQTGEVVNSRSVKKPWWRFW